MMNNSNITSNTEDECRAKINSLSRPSLVLWLARVSWNWIEIITLFLVMWHFDSILVDILCIVLLGTRQHALALLAHDAIHRSISRNKLVNDCFGNLLTSLPLFQSLGFFKTFHLKHHSYMLTDKDPEVRIREPHLKWWGVPFTKKNRILIFLRDLSGVGYLDSRHALAVIIPSLTIVDILAPLVFWSSALYLFSQLNLMWIPLYWTLSFVTSYWAMFRQRALTEHVGTEDTHRIEATILERFFFLPHNTWYHFEHHAHPNVPCWNLPELRTLMGGEARSVRDLFDQLDYESGLRDKNFPK